MAHHMNHPCRRERLSGNYYHNSQQYKYYSHRKASRELLTEHRHTYHYSRKRLKRSHHRRRRGAYLMNRYHHKHKREHRRQQRQHECTQPHARRGEHLYVYARNKRIGQDGEHTEEQHIERELERRYAQRRLVHHHYVYGVAERRKHHEQHAGSAQPDTAVTIIKQGNANKSQHYGKQRGGRQPFLEKPP